MSYASSSPRRHGKSVLTCSLLMPSLRSWAHASGPQPVLGRCYFRTHAHWLGYSRPSRLVIISNLPWSSTANGPG